MENLFVQSSENLFVFSLAQPDLSAILIPNGNKHSRKAASMSVWIILTEINGYKNIYEVYETEEKARQAADNMPWQYDRHEVWVCEYHVL